MYFSRITVDSSGRNIGRLGQIAGSGYRVHQALWQLFSEARDADRDFLYRREQRDGWPSFYLVSDRLPENGNGIWSIASKTYSPELNHGQRLAFSLRVNPVVSRKEENGKRVRHDVVMDLKKRIGYREMPQHKRPPLPELVNKAGRDWLRGRAERCGFDFEDKSMRIEGYLQHREYKQGSKRPIRFSTLDYSGLLTVTNPALFVETLYRGIGHAKAFGCGLMLVRRT